MWHAQGVTSKFNEICNGGPFYKQLTRSSVYYVHSYLALRLGPRSENERFSKLLIIESKNVFSEGLMRSTWTWRLKSCTQNKICYSQNIVDDPIKLTSKKLFLRGLSALNVQWIVSTTKVTYHEKFNGILTTEVRRFCTLGTVNPLSKEYS